jgi:Zn-dependent peptidase ImmA (M78 family)
MMARDYRKADEEAAYAVGAAGLVPFESLKRFVQERKTAVDIALHFRVSRELVEYRLKVTHLWQDYKAAH